MLTLRAEADTPADRAFLFALFASTKAAEMAQMPLDEAGRRFLLEAQFRSMSTSYRANFPDARFEIAERDGAPVGRLITDVQAACVYYVDIAVLPDRQRGGIATALMTAALEEPRRLGLPARVKVLSGNRASLQLCARLGFVVAAEVPPYLDLILHP